MGSRRCSIRLPHTTTSKLPDLVRIELVDAHEPALDLGVEQLGGDLEATSLLTGDGVEVGDPLGPIAGQPIPVFVVGQVGGPDLCGTPRARARRRGSRRRWPMSRQRFPRTSGHGMCFMTGRRSNQPGVTTPGATSMVWYQRSCDATASCPRTAAMAGRAYRSPPGARITPWLAIATDEGKGPLVVLLHGFPELPSSWRHQVGPLRDAGWRVVVPYLRGYGASPARPTRPTTRPTSSPTTSPE